MDLKDVLEMVTTLVALCSDRITELEERIDKLETRNMIYDCVSERERD